MFSTFCSIVLFQFQQILCCAWNWELTVDLDWLLVQRQVRKWVRQEFSKLFVHISLQVFLQNFKLWFFVQFHAVFDIPSRSKCPRFITVGLFHNLSNFFMLEIECLNGPSNIIITPDSFLKIFPIICIHQFHMLIITFEGNRRQIECEYCFSLFQVYCHIRLQFGNCEGFRVLLLSSLLLLSWLRFWVCLRFGTRHELRFLLEIRTTSLHLWIILCQQGITCELRELLTFTSNWSRAFFYCSDWFSRSFKYSSVYSRYLSVMRLIEIRSTL